MIRCSRDKKPYTLSAIIALITTNDSMRKCAQKNLTGTAHNTVSFSNKKKQYIFGVIEIGSK